MAVRIQHRRGTAANMTERNIYLHPGEWGAETDTHKVKIGPGYWNDLGYVAGEGSAGPEGPAGPGTEDLPELADGVGTRLNEDVEGFIGIDSTILVPSSTPVASNTVAETTISTFSLETSIDVGDGLEIFIGGAITNNTGSDRTVTLTLKLGSIVLITWPTINIPSDATARNWAGRVNLVGSSFIGTRLFGTGVLFISGTTTSAVDLGTYTRVSPGNVIDTSTSLTLTTTMSTASNNLSVNGGLGYVRRSVV